jgi:cardiolipin synthase
MLAAIDAARESVRLETYIYAPGALGDRFRAALIRAAQRGVRVRMMADALGSVTLPSSYFKPLQDAGGEARWFNPLSWSRAGIRDHRKLLVCDDRIAFVGGFNITNEYDGDGVTAGWRDVGLRLDGSLASQLRRAFDEMFERAVFERKRRRLRLPLFGRLKRRRHTDEQLLLSGPSWGGSPIKNSLRRDLATAGSAQIVTAYFLPTWRLRRQLNRIARNGGRVQLILAGKSDVTVSQLAARSLYRRFLKAGVEIYEYQPQVLHAKLIIANDAVYVGSANLDQRSLNINYELMVRFQQPEVTAQAQEVFQTILAHSRRITLEEWNRSRSLWRTLKQHWAYFLLARIDPYLARRQWRALPD